MPLRFHVELRRLGLSILALAFLSLARAAPFAYVPNERSGTVSVIDTASDQAVATIKTGGKPRGIAASPDGRSEEHTSELQSQANIACRLLLGKKKGVSSPPGRSPTRSSATPPGS